MRPFSRATRTVAALGAFAVMVVATGCGAFAQTPEPETVYIGADLELTGPDAERGSVYHDSLRLQVEHINQAGLVGSRNIELIVRDNRSDAGTSAANIAELAANPEVTAIVTGGCGECAVAAADAINESGVPTISLASLSEVAEPISERPYLFQLAPTAASTARVLTGELERGGAATVAVLASNDAYGEEGRQELADAAERAELDVVVARAVTNDEDSIAAAVDEVVAYQPNLADHSGLPGQGVQDTQVGPDAVVLWTPPEVAAELAEGLRGAGYEESLYLDAYAADELFLTGSSVQALEGARMVFTQTLVMDSVIASSPAKASRKNWFNDYLARHGTYHAYSSFAADALQVIAEAVVEADGTGRQEMRDALEQVQIEGLSGPIRLRLENHSGLSPQAYTVLVAQNDRWQPAAG